MSVSYTPQRKPRCKAKSTAFGQCELDRGHKTAWHSATQGPKTAEWTHAGDMRITRHDPVSRVNMNTKTTHRS